MKYDQMNNSQYDTLLANTIVTTSYTNFGVNWSDSAFSPIKGISLKDGADIVIDEFSLRETLQKINERLGILQLNSKLEEDWNELKELGDKYRALEKEILEKQKVWEILKT